VAADANFAPELGLLWTVLLNAAVLAAALWVCRRRGSASVSQNLLDAGLLWYAVQYLAVGVPGILRCLTPVSITVVALLLVALMVAVGWSGKSVEDGCESEREPAGAAGAAGLAGAGGAGRWLVLTAALLAAGNALAYAWFNRSMPVTTNDGLTYHFPAAVQWLQDGRIDLFQTWFFNPANTFSPLAGSTFIAWLIAPFGTDALARFVEVPALALVGVGVYRVGRELGADGATAALVAAGAVVARPMLHQEVMGLDDLFVVLFALSAVLGLNPARARERGAVLRVGVAAGLLLATKYTVLMSVPILLVGIDGPRRAGWKRRDGVVALAIAAALAGPWYLRNLWMRGNPVFPVALFVGPVRVLPGLFSVMRSSVLRSWGDVWRVLCGSFAAGPVLMVGMLLATLGLLAWRGRQLMRDPLLRMCTIGPMLGMLLFAQRAPFPEARFVFPCFALMLANVAGVGAVLPWRWAGWALAALLVCASGLTSFEGDAWSMGVQFALQGAAVAAVGLVIVWLVRRWPMWRWNWSRLALRAGLPALLAASGYAYVYWSGYLVEYQRVLVSTEVAWGILYPRDQPTWRFVNQNIPSDAVVAYTNMHLVYPLYGYGLGRRLVYVPTRDGVMGVGDLPYLGKGSGEELRRRADLATVADADEALWLQRLAAAGAQYLLVGKGDIVGTPPEAAFAASDPRHFQLLFDGPGAAVYRVTSAPQLAALP
jgi:hypothetical protein